jgi:hypothetical protein
MRYSVYNYTRRSYDYYEAPGPGGTHAGSPPATGTVGGVGTSPGRASWKLPAGARKVGTGDMPQGRIASMDGADGLSDPMHLVVYAAAAILAWRVFR